MQRCVYICAQLLSGETSLRVVNSKQNRRQIKTAKGQTKSGRLGRRRLTTEQREVRLMVESSNNRDRSCRSLLFSTKLNHVHVVYITYYMHTCESPVTASHLQETCGYGIYIVHTFRKCTCSNFTLDVQYLPMCSSCCALFSAKLLERTKALKKGRATNMAVNQS